MYYYDGGCYNTSYQTPYAYGYTTTNNNNYAIILVLFILLVIILGTRFAR